MSRGSRFTVEWRKPEYYSDFNASFLKNPTTGHLAMVTNEDSIQQSMYHLIMTAPGERPGQNAIGSKVPSTLFDLSEPQAIDVLKDTIEEVIRNFEPRATRVSVVVKPLPETHEVYIAITYTPINIPTEVTFTLILKRVR